MQAVVAKTIGYRKVSSIGQQEFDHGEVLAGDCIVERCVTIAVLKLGGGGGQRKKMHVDSGIEDLRTSR